MSVWSFAADPLLYPSRE